MIDAVLSYHTNPYTCGVAKFNQRLARELHVPFDDLCKSIRGAGEYRHPLISVKLAEIGHLVLRIPSAFDIFLHDWNANGAATIQGARRVYAANGVIARQAREHRPDVIQAWCPSTIEAAPPRADLTILTFGMAHKLTSPYYEKLRDLLEAHGQPYTILLSTGVHEGTPWDEALEGAASSLRAIFGRERVDVLGYLSDGALDREIRAATACAAFFSPALRANNTTAWAVLERGRPLITNLDADSPAFVCFDINGLDRWPRFPRDLPLQGCCGWSDLVTAVLEAPCAK